jgi:hypothetical protein
MKNDNYHLTTGKTISDLVIYYGYSLNIVNAPIVKNFFQKVKSYFDARKIDDTKFQEAMANTDTSTKVLEILDRVKNKTDDFIQQLFTEIMASEIEKEGSYSLETIHRLSLMTRKDLEYFYNNVAPFYFSFCGFFKTQDETSFNPRLLNLNINIMLDGKFPILPKFENTYESFVPINFHNNEKFYIQGKNVVKLEKRRLTGLNLNQFGTDLWKLGLAENKIRKWTEEDKKEILRVLKTCGIKENEVKFELTQP